MEDTEYNEHALCEFKTYKAVEQGLASIVHCLEEESPAMRCMAAAHALALFPRRLDIHIIFPLDEDSRKSSSICEVQGHYAASCSKVMVDNVFMWFCALALITLGLVQEEFVEKAERWLRGEAYRASLE
ncbi:hypothetical protein FIE12Z_12158, partial [Fusarium flagelliforme]